MTLTDAVVLLWLTWLFPAVPGQPARLPSVQIIQEPTSEACRTEAADYTRMAELKGIELKVSAECVLLSGFEFRATATRAWGGE